MKLDLSPQPLPLAYDADGNDVAITDANGSKATDVFDVLDRKATMAVPRAVRSLIFSSSVLTPGG